MKEINSEESRSKLIGGGAEGSVKWTLTTDRCLQDVPIYNGSDLAFLLFQGADCRIPSSKLAELRFPIISCFFLRLSLPLNFTHSMTETESTTLFHFNFDFLVKSCTFSRSRQEWKIVQLVTPFPYSCFGCDRAHLSSTVLWLRPFDVFPIKNSACSLCIAAGKTCKKRKNWREISDSFFCLAFLLTPNANRSESRWIYFCYKTCIWVTAPQKRENCVILLHVRAHTPAQSRFNWKIYQKTHIFVGCENGKGGNWLSRNVPTNKSQQLVWIRICFSIAVRVRKKSEMEKNGFGWVLTFLLLLKTEHLNVSVLPSRAI